MAQKASTTTQNNFNQGLKTEFTGLNFPENACTYTDNCTFERIGNVHRRNGFDYELNYTTNSINRVEQAISSFVWTNVGGDGETKIYVTQVGGTLYFYEFTNSTIDNPMSTTLLASTVNIGTFVASGGIFDPTQECQFAAGNGFLFVFQPTCDPFFCTFNEGVVTGSVIKVQIRDFAGIYEPGVLDTERPYILTPEHEYNLENQGWATSAGWQDTSNTAISLASATAPYLVPGATSFTVDSTTDPISAGQAVSIFGSIHYEWTNGTTYQLNCSMSGIVTSYVGNVMDVNVGTVVPPIASEFILGSVMIGANWILGPYGAAAQISTWFGQVGIYPSNADVWWQFKDDTDTFNPAVTLPNITLSSPAPTGSFVVDAFNINRSGVSGILGLTSLTTTARPRTGTWFQGRVFYAGVDASQQAIGDAQYYTWTENIYFSQIVTPGDNTEFGYCYEINDPTSENLFDLLPSDGGVINIQGCGSIYKLFPVVNGLLVFAANGIWFITGSQGIGFTAIDYTVTKLSGVQSISGRSFIDVLGYPVFWNEDSIYSVSQGQEGRGLQVSNLGITTINTFYQNIPLSSRQYARGAYNPLTFQIQWVYKSTQAVDTTTTYAFDSVLNFNTVTNAFYNWTVSSGSSIHDVSYIVSPGGLDTPDPVFKYLASSKSGGIYLFSFAEERDNVDWLDWSTTNYTSQFITGYSLHGGGITKFQPSYINVYSNNDQNTSYTIQGVWDYALIPDSGRFSSGQLIQNYVSTTNFGVVRRRHRIRGNGYVLQIQITSTPGMPFDIIGWAIFETSNAGT